MAHLQNGVSCPVDDAALLAGIHSAFQRMATFYTRDNAVARNARDALGPRDSFYTNLKIELDGLGKHISRDAGGSTLSTGDLAGDALTSILNILDGALRAEKLNLDLFTCLHGKPRHQRLHGLLHHLQVSQAESCPLKLSKLRDFVNMRFESKDRKILIKFLSQINNMLNKQNRTKAKQTLPPFTTFVAKDKKIPRTVSTKIRDQADRIYNLLTQYWKCENHNPHTAAKLRLYTYRRPGAEVRFDILFCAPNASDAGKSKWQETQVYAVLDEMELADSEKEDKSTAPAESKVVRFQAPETKISGRAREETHEVEGLCSLIQDHAERESLRLRILVDKDRLRWQPKKAPKYKLQVTLANAFLQFNEGLWLPTTWNKAHISFFCPDDGGYPDLSSPYLTTQCCRPHPGSEKSAFRGHPYPSLLALGILLLEIELGQPIEHRRDADSSISSHNTHYYIDADIPAAEDMLRDCEDESPTGFISAVRDCVEVDSFAADFGRNETFDNPKFRQAIFERIVKGLESALKSVWKGSPEELDDFSSTIKSTPKSKISSTRITHFQSSFRAISLRDNVPPVVTRKQDNKQREEKYSDEEKSDADNWFIELHKYIHPIFETQDSTITDPTTLKIFGNAGPVRVAIIDTGIDLPEVDLCLYEDRLKDSLSFFDDKTDRSAMKSEYKDLDGHGTHAAALILRVAPKADIYVARVFGSRNLGSTPAADIHDRIVRVGSKSPLRIIAYSSKAIDHAIDPTKWNVDIISMSFGFENSIPVIEKVIRRAADRNVIMLASPSNSGGKSPAAWPARHPDVIDIYATDSYGNKCNFTPNPPPKSERFAILGRAVKSSWPEDLDSNGEKRKSGTSIATPIAAGIAAMVLAYMKTLIAANGGDFTSRDVEMLSKIRTSNGMSVFFRNMVLDQRQDYSFLVPWDYIGVKDTTYRDPHIMIPGAFLRDIKRS
ncbi:hypothetical protein G7Y89_g8714 [Cudoniella acicularis]|uniref:Peptidase S8/S53 domain-containing protein n=1 Tax=Cudoniella acicularis TaxID=354080 RepID=A0A8H4RI80_9HELO|nr:hypothetical protein G7Y89_g8714 [Cudoniella acicularis]